MMKKSLQLKLRSQLLLPLSVLMSGLVTSVAAQAYVAETDVEYDYINGTSLKMDVYRPSNPGTALRPALLFFHGGCYNSGSKASINGVVKGLADEGFTVFSIGYRLTPVAKYPAGVTDVKQALRFIRKNSARFQVDPNKIVTHGESAGSYMAGILGVQPSEDRKGNIDKYSGRVQLVVDWFGRTDFTLTQTTGTDCAVDWIGQPRNDKTMQIFKDASLKNHVDQNSAAFYIVHGTHDTQVDPIHSTSLANTLWNRKRDAELVLYEGQGHGFSRTIPWALSRARILRQFGIPDRLAIKKIAGAPNYAINSGQPDKTPNTSNFTPDKYFVGGSMYDYGNVKTEGTSLSDLYTDSRYGWSFGYKLPVPAASVYRVGLFFAENSTAFSAKGDRVFDVSMTFPNGSSTISVPVLPKFDAIALGGKNTVIRRYVHVITKNPTINIGFQGRVNNAFINAFDLYQTGY